MASTKNMPKGERKHLKRKQRQANKALFGSLTRKERRELRHSESGLKAFLKEKGQL